LAGRGPAPKDPSKRRRRNIDPIPTTTVVDDGQLRGPDLPDDVLGGQDWHPRTQAWWETWRRSPQAVNFTATDWDFLIDTALMHHTMWAKGRWEFAAELRLRAGKFGATPEDRARLRLQITGDPATSAQPEQEKASKYAHLKVVAGGP